MGQPQERQFQFCSPQCFDEPRHQAVNRLKNVLLLHEGHFDVDLSELGLTVGSQVFVAKAFGQLKIPIKACDHQNLFIDLWRLWKSIKATLMNAARYQVVTCTLGRASSQHWRFNLQELVFVEIIASRF